jgi:nitrogen regulatory protein PII
MKMLTIICRDSLEADVRRLLNELDVKGYTVASGLGGKGQTGSVSEHATEDAQVGALADALKQLYVKLIDANHGEEVPLKVFLQPCEVIL